MFFFDMRGKKNVRIHSLTLEKAAVVFEYVGTWLVQMIWLLSQQKLKLDPQHPEPESQHPPCRGCSSSIAPKKKRERSTFQPKLSPTAQQKLHSFVAFHPQTARLHVPREAWIIWACPTTVTRFSSQTLQLLILLWNYRWFNNFIYIWNGTMAPTTRCVQKSSRTSHR